MRVMAQLSMVMNLDKCIGCHTCSVTCKQAWTNRPGVEYAWFNNVETRPGQGYPRTYEDQERWEGGWVRDKRGRLRLRAGGRIKKLATIFSNPKMPSIDDYYEPWTYDYENLTNAPLGEQMPVAPPRSLITGEPMKVEWSANWDDNLGGSTEILSGDPILAKVSQQVKLELEQTFMFYLPRICEHCLNPSCVASCPSGAMYKRAEDGIVLVDQDKCKGWRMCVTGCPYKKVYFNHRTGKAEKCTFCYPRIEVGLPTVCAETCVGRLRYIGLVLYDADRVLEAASTANETDLYEAQLDVMLDPNDPDGHRGRPNIGDLRRMAGRGPPIAGLRPGQDLPDRPAAAPGIPHHADGLVRAAALAGGGRDQPRRARRRGPGEPLRRHRRAAHPHRIPGGVVQRRRHRRRHRVLKKLAAMRAYMRDINLGREPRAEIPASVGMGEELMYEMYRLLAIAKYEARYVIPTAYATDGHRLEETVTECSLDFEGGPGMYTTGSGPFGEASGQPVPMAVESFQALKQRQTSEDVGVGAGRPSRVNLLNWDGKGSPDDDVRAPARFSSSAGQRRDPDETAPAQRVSPVSQRRIVWQAASLLLAYPDAGQAAAARPGRDGDRRPGPGSAAAAARRRRSPAFHPVDRGVRAVRGGVRLETPAHPVPDLLHGGRHPEPRNGPAGVLGHVPRRRGHPARPGIAGPPRRAAGIRCHRRRGTPGTTNSAGTARPSTCCTTGCCGPRRSTPGSSQPCRRRCRRPRRQI